MRTLIIDKYDKSETGEWTYSGSDKYEIYHDESVTPYLERYTELGINFRYHFNSLMKYEDIPHFNKEGWCTRNNCASCN